jgi:26S proteasome regulatory subunit N1
MTYSDTQPRGTLRYRLLSASLLPSSKHISEPGLWGHEYVRHLASELGEEYRVRELGEEEEVLPEKPVETESEAKPEEKKPEEKKPQPKLEPIGTMEELKALALECAQFLLQHNAEPDAVDLLEELEIVDQIVGLVDENTYGRVCQYMIACVPLLPQPDDVTFLRTAHDIYVKFSKFPESLSVAIRLNDRDLIKHDFHASANPVMQRQLAFILARSQVPKEWVYSDESEEIPEDLLECLSNAKLSQHFRDFGKELGVLEPKSLEDVYKSHLENTSMCPKDYMIHLRFQ